MANEAAIKRRVEAAKRLVEAGADVTLKRGGTGWPRAGWTALHYCAGYGFSEVAELLVERGADVNEVDDEGKTALQVAVELARPEVAKVLINKQREGERQ
jgi:hypothetical protein